MDKQGNVTFGTPIKTYYTVHNLRKNTERTVQSKWLADFSCLLLDSDSVSYCNIWRKYSNFADKKSLMKKILISIKFILINLGNGFIHQTSHVFSFSAVFILCRWLVGRSSTIKSWPTFCDQYFWKFPIWNSRADEKRREIRMVKVFKWYPVIDLFYTFTGKLKGVCGRLRSPAQETQSMREIRLLRGRFPRKGGGLTGMQE
jgi:hypothetical protein